MVVGERVVRDEMGSDSDVDDLSCTGYTSLVLPHKPHGSLLRAWECRSPLGWGLKLGNP